MNVIIKPDLKPIKNKHGEELYSKRSALLFITNQINDPSDNYFLRRAKNMKENIDQATALVDQAIVNLSNRFDILESKETEITDGAKKAASKLKVASENIGQGIARLEKAANFDKLERLVSVLERAADALEKLSELEKLGKLEKIAEALK